MITISGLNYITIAMYITKLSFDLLIFILKNQQLQEIILFTMKALETKASFRLDEKKSNLLILRLSPLIRCRPFPSKFFRSFQTWPDLPTILSSSWSPKRIKSSKSLIGLTRLKIRFRFGSSARSDFTWNGAPAGRRRFTEVSWLSLTCLNWKNSENIF